MDARVLSKSEKIALLNDHLRSTFLGGVVLVTASFEALPADLKARVLLRVRRYDGFTLGNDPYKERDFGSFEMSNRRFNWKIDYYDKEMEHGSPDASDPAVTTRTLTIGLAEDF